MVRKQYQPNLLKISGNNINGFIFLCCCNYTLPHLKSYQHTVDFTSKNSLFETQILKPEIKNELIIKSLALVLDGV